MPMSSLPSGYTPRRCEARLRVRLAARVVALSGIQSVQVNDLSRSGAGITLAEPLTIGKTVLLQWRSLDHFATVVWTNGERCGVRFEEPIPMEILLEARRMTDNHLAIVRQECRDAAHDFVWGKYRRA
jgi:hypothetical protein